MKRFAAVSLAALAISGCLEKSQQDEGLAKAVAGIERSDVSANSPDVAVKSWWRVKDAGAVMYVEACKSLVKTEAPYLAKLSELSTPDIYSGRNCSKTPDTFDRQITKVEVQSDTRAIVMAQIRNTTPPDEGAVLSEDDKARKEAGEAFQYVLERNGIGEDWKIAKVSNMPSWARDWEVLFKKPKPSTNRWVYESQQ